MLVYLFWGSLFGICAIWRVCVCVSIICGDVCYMAHVCILFDCLWELFWLTVDCLGGCFFMMGYYEKSC